MAEGRCICEYQILTEISVGLRSSVYLALNTKTGQHNILKEFLYDPYIDREEQRLSFIREIEIHLGVHHSNIINSVKSFESNNSLFLVIEYTKGKTLDELSSQLNFVQAVEIIYQLCIVTQYLHEQNIIHRDLNTSNILITENLKPLLIDFSYAKYIYWSDLDNIAIPVTNYISPEQLLDTENIDGRTDIFSLGVMLYEMLTGGHFPFTDCAGNIDYEKNSTPIRNLNPYIPLNLETIVHKAINKDPDYRFSTAKKMSESLKKILGEPDIYFNVGKLTEKKGDRQLAKRFYGMALQFNEKHLNSWQSLGDLYLMDKDWLNAKNCFMRLIRLDSSKADAYFQLGNINYELNFYNEALKMYQLAWTCKSTKEFEIKIAHALCALNRYDEAIDHYTGMIAKYSDWDQLYYELGKLYYSMNEKDKALYHFQIASERNPASWEILYNLATLYQEKEDLMTCITYYQRVLTLKPDFYEAKHNLAYAYFKRGDLEVAKKHLEELLILKPEWLNSHIILGYVFEKMSLKQSACEQFRHALILAPYNIEPYLQLSAFYRRQWRVDEAIKILEEGTLKLDKLGIDILYPLASLYSEKGEYEKAIKTFESCMKCTNDRKMTEKIQQNLNIIKKHMNHYKIQKTFTEEDIISKYIENVS